MTQPEDNKLRRILLTRDHNRYFEELYSDVYIAAGGDMADERNFYDILVRSRCNKADCPEESDLVIFTGGPDVDPAYYGETQHPSVYVRPGRDQMDIDIYLKCLELGIPMVGICRGAQFLHVMNGGKLYQDVNNHQGDHQMYDISGKRMISKVSSVHHQMVRWTEGSNMLVLADARKSTKRWLNKEEEDTSIKDHLDIEAFYYTDTACFGVQGHPEYKGYDEFAYWFINQINELFNLNPDIALEGKYRRLKKEIRDRRFNLTEGVVN